MIKKSGPTRRKFMECGADYRSTIKSTAFLYKETKKAASLKIQGFKDFEIREMAKKENIFQVHTEKRKGEIASAVLQRLNILDEYLIEKVATGNLETSKIIVLYAIAKTDRLFSEFINEVYREKLIMNDFILSHRDLNIYFQRKREQSERVASWSDHTIYKLKQTYRRMLFEAGLIKRGKAEDEIVRPLIEPEVIDYFRLKGEGQYIRALLGEI